MEIDRSIDRSFVRSFVRSVGRVEEDVEEDANEASFKGETLKSSSSTRPFVMGEDERETWEWGVRTRRWSVRYRARASGRKDEDRDVWGGQFGVRARRRDQGAGDDVRRT